MGRAQDGESVGIGQSRKGRGTGSGSVWIEVVVRQRLQCL